MSKKDVHKRRYSLMYGDCFDRLTELDKGSISLCLTDMPYNMSKNKWDTSFDLDAIWILLKRVLKQNAVSVLFGSQPFSSLVLSSNIDQFKYSLVWVKNKASGHLNAKKIPLKRHEDILVFGSGVTNYYPQMTEGHKPMNASTNSTRGTFYGNYGKVVTKKGHTKRYPTSILEFPVVNNDGSSDGGRFHPTQKPVDLLEYLIKTYTLEKETVLDFTMGSASTGIACLNTNRKFIGIEKDKEYFRVARRRMRKHKLEM